MGLYDKIKVLANKQKISIRALEETLGYGNGTIRRWDKQTPGVDKLSRVADYFEVSVDYLLGRDSERTINEVDLAKMIDNAMSFDGKPLSDHDKEIAKAYLEGKFSKD